VGALSVPPGARILEIGCGTGLNFSLLVNPLDPSEGRLTGLDFSIDMLRKAGKRKRREGWSHVDLVAADACRMPFAGEFDVIFFAYSLTMIPDWPCALEKAYERLAPGGRLGVLDFDTCSGWGPLGGILRFWLRLHHVEPARPYVEKLEELFGKVDVTRGLGGYYFHAVGTKERGG
jgi:ubiquinone/menaquinone biosynthesis C-methylase UbiE